MAKTTNNNTTEQKLEDIVDKEEPKTEIVVQEDSKLRKVVTYCLKGLAFIATGVVGFFIGRGTAKGSSDDDENDEENEEE